MHWARAQEDGAGTRAISRERPGRGRRSFGVSLARVDGGLPRGAARGCLPQRALSVRWVVCCVTLPASVLYSTLRPALARLIRSRNDLKFGLPLTLWKPYIRVGSARPGVQVAPRTRRRRRPSPAKCYSERGGRLGRRGPISGSEGLRSCGVHRPGTTNRCGSPTSGLGQPGPACRLPHPVARTTFGTRLQARATLTA